MICVTTSVYATEGSGLCQKLLATPAKGFVSILVARGYEESVAERIVSSRIDLVPLIIARPFAGKPGYVSRGICVSPTDFDPLFQSSDKVYVTAQGFTDVNYSAFSCPGGIAIEMQIPQFLFRGWSSGSYSDAIGRWGYLQAFLAKDLSPFITRVEIEPLNSDNPVHRLSYEEFLQLVGRLKISGDTYSARFEARRSPGKRPKF